MNKGTRGRQHLGHLTRSGIVMLCAAWESYIEDVCLECMNWFLQNSSSPSELPGGMQKRLAHCVSKDKHELASLKLAGDGWRTVFIDYAKANLSQFNSPKPDRIDLLFEEWIGLSQITSAWSTDQQDITDFVVRRGEIAHRGTNANYVRRPAMERYRALVWKTSCETDNKLLEFLRQIKPSLPRPWNTTTIE